MDDYHRLMKVGPGGFRCPCCVRFGTRQLLRKLARTRLREETRREVAAITPSYRKSHDDEDLGGKGGSEVV